MVFQGNGPPWTDCQRSCVVCGWPKMEKTVLLLVIVVLWGSTGYAQSTTETTTLSSTTAMTDSTSTSTHTSTTTTKLPEGISTQALETNITGLMENVKKGIEDVKKGIEDVKKGIEDVERACNQLIVVLIFFIVILMVLGGAVIYLYLERMKSSRDSEKHYFVEKSQHSTMSCTSATVELRPSNTSRQSTFVASQPLSTHNSHLNHTRNMSGSERDDTSRKHLHPPLSKPPPPSDTQEPKFPISGSLGDVDESLKNPRHVPSSPPPAPKPTPDSMFPKTSGSLGDADHYPADNDADDDEHDYDYLDINMLKQQMDKEKEAEQRQEQMGKEDTITPKKGEREKVTEEGEAILSRHDSENSLYNIIVEANCKENEIEMESNL